MVVVEMQLLSILILLVSWHLCTHFCHHQCQFSSQHTLAGNQMDCCLLLHSLDTSSQLVPEGMVWVSSYSISRANLPSQACLEGCCESIEYHSGPFWVIE